jgi:hypothetical protein
MRGVSAAMALAVLASLFAGCILEDGTSAAEPIVKKVRFVLNPDTLESEELDQVLRVKFEYTHRGATVAADELLATFTDTQGHDVDRALSRYTSLPQVRDGDIVTIEPVNLTSGLVIRHAGQVLVKRDGLNANWYTAGGYPLPLTTTTTGIARYTLEGSSGLSARGKDFDLDQVRMHSMEANLDARADGTLTIESKMPGRGPRLEAEGRFKATASAKMDADYTEDGERQRAGFDARFQAWFNQTGTLQFDRANRLVAAGGGGDVWADGDVIAWDKDHPRAENWRPEDLEHPLVDEEWPYSEEELDLDPSDAEAVLVDFLRRLWDTRIGVGDEYLFEASSGEGDSYFRYTFGLQVTGKERRQAAGQSFETYRIAQTMSFVVRTPETGRTNFELATTTLWVSADYYLPVYEQATYRRTFEREDLRRILQAMGDDSPFTLPNDPQVVLTGEYVLRLSEHRGDFMIAPVLGLAGWSGGAPALLGAGASTMFMSDFGGDSYDAAPSIWFTASEAEDHIQVSAAASGADWDRIRVQTNWDGVRFELNGPATMSSTPIYSWSAGAYVWHDRYLVMAGHYLAFCVEGDAGNTGIVRMTIEDYWANQVLGEFEFLSLRPCL